MWTAGMKHRVRLRGGGSGEGRGGEELMRGALRGGEEGLWKRDGEGEGLGGKGERMEVERLLLGILRAV